MEEDQRLRIQEYLADLTKDAERLLGEAQRAQESFARGDVAAAAGLVSLSESTLGQLQKVHQALFERFEAQDIEPRL